MYELSSQYRDLRQTMEDDLDERPKKKKRADEAGRGDGGPRRGARAPRARATRVGYRYHAVVPEAEAMDYKVRPGLVHDPSEIKARTQMRSNNA